MDSDFLKSSRFLRPFTWISALLLVAGVVAFATVRLGRGESRAAVPPATTASPTPRSDTSPSATVPSAAKKVAGDFIIAAAGRKDLAKAWKITDPELKAQCVCSYKEWLTGDIPVQNYPLKALDVVTFAPKEITADEVYLEVVLLPKKGTSVKAQAFNIGLKASGHGSARHWLVNYWAPAGQPPVPAQGAG